MQTFDLAQLPQMPWKNGGGTTLEIVRWPEGSTLENFDWRVSVARLSASGPFSVLPGVDRWIMLLDGEGARLRSPEGAQIHALTRRHAVFAFPGEAVIEADLAGGHSRDFNLMVRRGKWRGQMGTASCGWHLEQASAGVCLVLAGRWRCAGKVLGAGQGLHWRQPDEAAVVEPVATQDGEDPLLAWVSVRQVASGAA